MINVVITTKFITKCIFLNFGVILKRLVKLAKLNSQKLKPQCRVHIKFIYKNKIKLFTEKETKSPSSSSSSSCPTPHSSPAPYYPQVVSRRASPSLSQPTGIPRRLAQHRHSSVPASPCSTSCIC